MNYTWTQLGFFLLLYAFAGWCSETVLYAIIRRKFVNVGFLTLPFVLTDGIIMALLAAVLPSFGDNLLAQFFMTLIVSSTVARLGAFNVRKLCPGIKWPQRGGVFIGTLRGFAASLTLALLDFLTYQILHPLIVFLLPLIHPLLLSIIVIVLLAAILADMIFVIVAVRQGTYNDAEYRRENTRLGNRLINHIWKRLQKSYPGIRDMSAEEEREIYTFARGMSLDKILWIFLLSALLGDLIETVYCRLTGGVWMNRSSVLYGPFSFVWGIGAVLLTVTLSPLARRNDRWVFLGGFFIGGAYEYLCSVFTELVFGTVFWDYSSMPLNIGGRTNVLFMFFWGLLSVIWIKMIYPNMSRWIEKIPPITGKILTWGLVAAMLLNGALTAMAMLRYNIRQSDPEPHSQYDTFIDTHYPDVRIETRWPNMIVVEKNI